MRYDRIYFGACANSRSKYLYRLLEVGGVLVGPFQAGPQQQLRRVVRWSETEFRTQNLESVRFAALVEPSPLVSSAREVETMFAFAPRPRVAIIPSEDDADTGDSGDDGQHAWQHISRRLSISTVPSAGPEIGLPGIPFTFALRERPWTPERCHLYPPSFRRTVALSLQCRPRDESIPFLPAEIWIQHVFPWCPKGWFEEPLALEMAPSRFAYESVDLPPSSCEVATCASVEEELSDDGGSTRAPSAQTTPQFGPGQPPTGMDRDEPIEAGSVLFEVYGNGQRHAIGAEGDPDDYDMGDRDRQVLPLQVLQLLRAVTRTHDEMYVEQHDVEDDDQDMEIGEEEYDEEEGEEEDLDESMDEGFDVEQAV